MTVPEERRLVSRCTVPVCLRRRHTVLWRGEQRCVLPAEPDIRCRDGLVLATQRHITGAGEVLPSLHGQRQMRTTAASSDWSLLRLEEFKRLPKELFVVLEDPAVSGVGVEGYEFAVGQTFG